MRTTRDDAGRRDAPVDVKLVKRGSLTVAVARKRVPPLTGKVVRQTLDRVRRRGADEGE